MFISETCNTYNESEWQNRVKSALDSTEPAPISVLLAIQQNLFLFTNKSCKILKLCPVGSRCINAYGF